MIYVIIALVLGILVIPALIIGFVLTKDGLARQKRISQMKKFRASVRGRQADLTDADRRTIA